MPLCKCPRCAALFDFHVHDVKAWHDDNWPGYSPSQLTPEVCPACQRDEQRKRLVSQPPSVAGS
jgi:hypothetical protein